MRSKTSVDRGDMRLTYLPFLRQRLVAPLAKGEDGTTEVIDLMDEQVLILKIATFVDNKSKCAMMMFASMGCAFSAGDSVFDQHMIVNYRSQLTLF
jgi:hypothetical protein